VLYFEDRSTDSSLGYLADGLSEELRGRLREARELRVISPGGAEQVRGQDLPADSIARILGAGTLVRGSIAPDGGDIRVSVELVDGSGAEIARASFRRPAGDALALRDSLAVEVAGMVRRRLGDQVRLGDLRAGTRDVEAWVVFQRAERRRREFDSLAAAGDTLAAWRAWTEADSLLRAGQARDPRWIEPRTERARLAYARSRLAVDDLLTAERWIAIGMRLADSALALGAQDADALELRGNLRYWRWLLQLERDPPRAEALLVSAKSDLEQARTVRPSQAGAWASLSHLYNQTGTSTDVKNAAQRALEADAFLSNADVILQRIFYAAYDDGDVIGARDACAQGARRFPANPRFTECRLMMMTMRGDSADPARAWRLADSLVALSPTVQQPYQRRSAAMWTAAVLARAGLADSARATARRSAGDATVDPSRDLANIGAFVFTLLGDTTQALERIGAYLDVNPGRRQAFAENPGWWFRPLEGSPGFRRLVGPGRP
jgi:serine/threonine-protein kinase